MKFTTKKLVTLALLSALAYAVAAAFTLISIAPIPGADFLKLDPKDVIIVISGFVFGPLAAVMMSFVTALLELFTVSRTHFLGFVMNFISSCAFALPAVFVYRYKKNFLSAVLGIIFGLACLVPVMVLWNWLITPLYMSVPREFIVTKLVPWFVVFNLIKGGMNAVLTLMLFKPLTAALRMAKAI